jgi:hypothetical protein
MGDVYRARDTSLGRDAALKVLPEPWSADPSCIARFRREARVLASLHHPNVATLFGFHDVDGVRFLAMELVEGEDLAQRLLKGPLPVAETLAILQQVAEGLEEAHEQGIVHRDLKPANVRVTSGGRAKVLDFGLAQALRDEPLGEAASDESPTLNANLTRIGAVLGTAGYMSPEQARGKPVDRRTDIWSFGCLLYECLTGRPAFSGETVTDTLVAVLEREPDWSALPPGTPRTVRDLLRRCLRRNPEERKRDIGDARVLIQEARGRLSDPSGRRMAGLVGAVIDAIGRRPGAGQVSFRIAALLGAVALGALARGWFLPATDPPPPLSVVLSVPDLNVSRPDGNAAIAPDGSTVAYVGGDRLRVRSLRRFEERDVPGGLGAAGFGWSPGSDVLAFVNDHRLWTWSLDTAESRPVCAIPLSGECTGIAWMADDRIHFCLYAGGIWAVPAAGGEPELVLSPGDDEFDFHLPSTLPGGTEFVSVARRVVGPQEVFVFDTKGRRRHTVLHGEAISAAAYSPSGHLLLTRNGGAQEVSAVEFSVWRRSVSGEEFPLEPGLAYPSVAGNGDIVALQGRMDARFDLLRASPDGRWEQVADSLQGLESPAVSPDGQRVACSMVTDGNRDVWVLDLERGSRLRLTSDRASESRPRWSRDGEWIHYASRSPGRDRVMRVPAAGGASEVLGEAQGATPLPGGTRVLVERESRNRKDVDLLVLDPETGQMQPWLVTKFTERAPALSPDGQWIAYQSNEPGRFEVMLRAADGSDPAWPVSAGGGTQPEWDPSGRMLYFLGEKGLMRVSLEGGPTPAPGRPEPVFPEHESLLDPGSWSVGFSAAPGPHFLVVRPSMNDRQAGILLMRGWRPER